MDFTILSLIMSGCVIVLLALILVALIVAIPILRRSQHVTLDTSRFEAEIECILNASAHAADVSAVLKLMEQLDEQPDALELIKNYPETVRAAAWLHYINTLGADLQAAQKQLSDAHRGKGAYQDAALYGGMYGNITKMREAAQQHVDTIRAKLDAAIAASGQGGIRLVN